MTMIEVKTSELIGAALDWAVAQASGLRRDVNSFANLGWSDGALFHPDYEWSPSTDWGQGGPLIEKYRVQTSYNGQGFRTATGEYWCAYACKPSGQEERPSGGGGTPLVAAMRAIVARKHPNVVSVPAELVGGTE